MRGKEHERPIKGEDEGITPAHAGKRDPAQALASDAGDHPRTCGEKQSCDTIHLIH